MAIFFASLHSHVQTYVASFTEIYSFNKVQGKVIPYSINEHLTQS